MSVLEQSDLFVALNLIIKGASLYANESAKRNLIKGLKFMMG